MARSRRATGQRPLERLPVELARLRHDRHDPDGYAALALQRPPGRDVCVVIELRDDDLVARAPAAPESTCEMEGQRRHVGAEGHLIGTGAEQVGERFASAGQDRVGLAAARVSPVSIGVVMQQILGDRIADGARHLGAAGAVEVGDGQASVTPLQGREVGADLVHRGDAGLAGCGD